MVAVSIQGLAFSSQWTWPALGGSVATSHGVLMETMDAVQGAFGPVWHPQSSSGLVYPCRWRLQNCPRMESLRVISRLCAAETETGSAEKLIELEADSSGIMRNTPRGEIATSKWNLHVRFIGIHNCPSDLNRTLFL